MFAYQKHLQSTVCLESALALLAVSASQALWARDVEPAAPLREFVDVIRAIVPPFETRSGRNFGGELHVLQGHFANGPKN